MLVLISQVGPSFKQRGRRLNRKRNLKIILVSLELTCNHHPTSLSCLMRPTYPSTEIQGVASCPEFRIRNENSLSCVYDLHSSFQSTKRTRTYRLSQLGFSLRPPHPPPPPFFVQLNLPTKLSRVTLFVPRSTRL